MVTESRDFLGCAETAKLVRAALRAEFPGIKFSVRSKTYSGGASIRVGWTDGPSEPQVRAVTALYEGATFDGMVDLKSYHTSILVDEKGNPREVHFRADFIFTDREFSPEFTEFIVRRIREKYAGCQDFTGSPERYLEAWNCYESDMLHRERYQLPAEN